MNRRLWLALGLAVAVGATGWMAWHNHAGLPAQDDLSRTDYVLHDFEMVSLGVDGRERITLRAPRLSRRTDDESLDIVDPTFLLPDSEGHHWELRARSGWVSDDGDRLVLHGGVEASSPADGPQPATRIATETLTVLPDRHLAQTVAPVRLSQPGLVMTGTGMELDTASRHLRLLSQVKTRYEPAAR